MTIFLVGYDTAFQPVWIKRLPYGWYGILVSVDGTHARWAFGQKERFGHAADSGSEAQERLESLSQKIFSRKMAQCSTTLMNC